MKRIKVDVEVCRFQVLLSRNRIHNFKDRFGPRPIYDVYEDLREITPKLRVQLFRAVKP